jgi:hypothetical protein
VVKSELVLSRRAVKTNFATGKTGPSTHFIEAKDVEWTLCHFKILRQDTVVNTISEGNVIACDCDNCLKALKEAADKGEVKIARVKKKIERLDTPLPPLINFTLEVMGAGKKETFKTFSDALFAGRKKLLEMQPKSGISSEKGMVRWRHQKQGVTGGQMDYDEILDGASSFMPTEIIATCYTTGQVVIELVEKLKDSFISAAAIIRRDDKEKLPDDGFKIISSTSVPASYADAVAGFPDAVVASRRRLFGDHKQFIDDHIEGMP